MTDIRRQILDAAKRVLETKGMTGATTREIAKAAGLADGTLYNHFAGREELFISLFRETVPLFGEVLGGLSLQIGEGSVAKNLEAVVIGGLDFFRKSLPVFTGLMAEPELLSRFREQHQARGGGPQNAQLVLVHYLKAEQQLGRIAKDAHPEVMTDLLMASFLFRAFNERFLGGAATGEQDKKWARELIRGILRGCRPEDPKA